MRHEVLNDIVLRRRPIVVRVQVATRSLHPPGP